MTGVGFQQVFQTALKDEDDSLTGVSDTKDVKHMS
jgi:hypothetical protein